MTTRSQEIEVEILRLVHRAKMRGLEKELTSAYALLCEIADVAYADEPHTGFDGVLARVQQLRTTSDAV